jgi:dipeptidyl aminopeptidase/acylaminoacyl peptidase
MLHTWGYDLEQRFDLLEAETEARGWLLLQPNFRGRNDHPAACGSPLAQQDILDAVSWVRSHHSVDERRIYVLGWSGGGFMTMLMAARYPQTWAAASAGAGISDLQAWYTERQGDEIGAQLRGCFGGAPTDSEKLASQYRDQSPLTYLRPGLGVPLDLAAGKDDPQVSVRHSLRAFRALAPDGLSEAEIESLLANSGSQHQSGSGSENDPLIPRRIFLRRTVGQARLTIFDGQHDWFHKAALEWLSQHSRP